MPPKINMIGRQFGRLTVIAEADGRDGGGGFKYHCRCTCGGKTAVRGASLRSGHATSCGCARLEKTAKHGLWQHPLYAVWKGMMARCYNPKHKAYSYYGAQGVKVDERWHDPQRFVADIGLRPSPGHSIDRIDPFGDYTPCNCRWATKKQQANNKRSTKEARA